MSRMNPQGVDPSTSALEGLAEMEGFILKVDARMKAYSAFVDDDASVESSKQCIKDSSDAILHHAQHTAAMLLREMEYSMVSVEEVSDDLVEIYSDYASCRLFHAETGPLVKRHLIQEKKVSRVTTSSRNLNQRRTCIELSIELNVVAKPFRLDRVASSNSLEFDAPPPVPLNDHSSAGAHQAIRSRRTRFNARITKPTNTLPAVMERDETTKTTEGEPMAEAVGPIVKVLDIKTASTEPDAPSLDSFARSYVPGVLTDTPPLFAKKAKVPQRKKNLVPSIAKVEPVLPEQAMEATLIAIPQRAELEEEYEEEVEYEEYEEIELELEESEESEAEVETPLVSAAPKRGRVQASPTSEIASEPNHALVSRPLPTLAPEKPTATVDISSVVLEDLDSFSSSLASRLKPKRRANAKADKVEDLAQDLAKQREE